MACFVGGRPLDLGGAEPDPGTVPGLVGDLRENVALSDGAPFLASAPGGATNDAFDVSSGQTERKAPQDPCVDRGIAAERSEILPVDDRKRFAVRTWNAQHAIEPAGATQRRVD